MRTPFFDGMGRMNGLPSHQVVLEHHRFIHGQGKVRGHRLEQHVDTKFGGKDTAVPGKLANALCSIGTFRLM